MTKPQKPPKHVPQRTCVACRQKRQKWELARIVRTPQGAIEIDPSGRKAGRGAYLCLLQNCWETGLKKKRLEHALKTEFIPEQRARLLEHGRALSTNEKDIESYPKASREGACA